MAFSLLSSLATLVGALQAYAALGQAPGAVATSLAMTAENMIHVAVADLMPGLHKRTGIRATVQRVLLIAAGIGTVVLADRIVDSLAG